MSTSIKWPPSLFGRHVRISHADFVKQIEAKAMEKQTAPLDATSRVSLREITRESVRAISWLDVGPGQDGLVAPNAFSIAQAYFCPEAWFRAIYADETPVGFAMMEDWSQVSDRAPELYKGERYVSLWRFMIDARYQKSGYGEQAILLLIEQARSTSAAVMLLSFVPKENNPEGFYQRFGFTRTGEMDDDEVVMALRLIA